MGNKPAKIDSPSIHRWSIADTVTTVRIVSSLFLLFLPLRSAGFFVIYLLTGLTDVLDGFLARKTGTACEFGVKLDSIADLLFFGIILMRMVPVMWQRLPLTIWYAVAAVLLVRLAAYAAAAVRYRRFIALHTIMNKLTGVAVFLLPCIWMVSRGVIYSWAVCVLAFSASLEELLIHLCRKDGCAEPKTILQKADVTQSVKRKAVSRID